MYKRLRKIFLNYIPTFIKTGLLYRIPFLYFLLEIKPSSCIVMLTNRCNLKCIMCKQWMEPQGEELLTEDWKRIIKDLSKNGIRNIHFTGGEPLLRKETLKELIAYSNRSGFATGFTTNGLLLSSEILQELIDAGLRSIAISMDALNGEYEQMRGVPSSFMKVKAAASLISEMKRKKRINAYINFVLMNNTIDKFEDVKRFADELKLPVAICLLDKSSSIFNLEQNKRSFWISKNEDYRRLQNLLNFIKEEKIRKPYSLLVNFTMLEFIEKYFVDPQQRQIPCVSSQDRIIIDPYGNFLGGCLSKGNFGNIKDKTFNELRKEKKYQLAKKNMFYKKCPGCSCGYQFNIQNFPDFIARDLFRRIERFTFGKLIWQRKD